MARDKISEYDATAANNTVVGDVNIDEACPPSSVNNALREILSHLKDMDVGTFALTSPKFTAISGPISVDDTTDSTSATSGSIHTDGGLGVVKDVWVNGDITVSNDTADAGTGAVAQLFLASAATPAKHLGLGFDNTNSHGYLQSMQTSVGWLPMEYDASSHIFKLSSAEKIRMTATGLGIGVTSPTEKLTVHGAIRSTSSSAGFPLGVEGMMMDSPPGYGRIGTVQGTSTGGYVMFIENGAEKMRLTGGNVGIAMTAPARMLSLTARGTATADQAGISLVNEVGTGAAIYQGPASSNALHFDENGATRMTISAGGYVGIGVTAPSYPLDVRGAGSAGTQISRYADATPTEYVGIFNANSGSDAPNAANATLKVRGMGVTSRSINAGGTVNASGADYAEYMTKADGCGTIAKGAVCGVDSDGKLTDVFANAHSFVIKSTDPSYVGGDKWGLASTDSDGNETMLEGAALEAARQKVDRIAFSGQVPCSVTGDAAVGDYIIPQKKDNGIEVVAVTSPTFEQYQTAVGKVWKLNDSGKHTVAVKIG